MTYLTADFNALDEHGRVWLPAAERANVERGQRVVLSDGEIEVDAVLSYDASRSVWLGIPDRSTARTVSESSDLPTLG